MKRVLFKFRPWGISFFTGFGGMDAGVKRAGFQTLLGSDKALFSGIAFANNTKERNPDLPDHLQKEGAFLSGEEGDIRNLDAKKVFDAIWKTLGIRVKRGQVHLVFGGPPCQYISVANSKKRNPFARLNLLVFELLRMVKGILPKVVVIEQVPALLGPKMKPLWNKIRFALSRMKAYTWGYKVMDSKDYGGRQARKRLIIMLVRNDLSAGPSFPVPTKPDMDKVSLHRLLPHITHFSSGQSSKRIISSFNKMFCTMTATGSELVNENDGVIRKLTPEEKKALTEFEDFNLDGLTQEDIDTGFGNMVQPSLMYTIAKHIRENILKC